ncbi:hypothetical protein [Arthrobacter pigmenti]
MKNNINTQTTNQKARSLRINKNLKPAKKPPTTHGVRAAGSQSTKKMVSTNMTHY